MNHQGAHFRIHQGDANFRIWEGMWEGMQEGMQEGML